MSSGSGSQALQQHVFIDRHSENKQPNSTQKQSSVHGGIGSAAVDSSSPHDGVLKSHVHDPRWILVAWGVVALAAALRFWRMTQPFRAGLTTQNRFGSTDLDQARASLERSWRAGERRGTS